jgi:hypothetical protein
MEAQQQLYPPVKQIKRMQAFDLKLGANNPIR